MGWIEIAFGSDYQNFRADRQERPVIRGVFLSLFVILVIPFQPVFAEEAGEIQTNDVIVFFEGPLESAANEVAEIYSGLKLELEETLGWRMSFRPKVLLINNRRTFTRIAGSHLFVALAIPQRKLVVIDYSKMNTAPFTLGTTLKHELCHLLLYHHIGTNLPKWLDEGVSQWVSDGIAEIIMGRRPSVLKEAALSGNYIGIRELMESFPEDKRSLLLAYEESRSLVEYIHGKFGLEGIRSILANLKDGHEVDVAILKSLLIPLDELERKWHAHLRRKTTWFTYLTANLYVILFFLAALITIVGFIRIIIKKRRYYDSQDDYPLHSRES